MAAVARTVICQQRDIRMTNKLRNSPALVADQPVRKPPVRVKLVRPDAFVSQAYPPDGDSDQWWRRLNQALGHGVQRFRERIAAPSSSSGSLTVWENLADGDERGARDDRGRSAER